MCFIVIFRYLIVRKSLIMDKWIGEGKATTFAEAVKRFESMGESSQDAIREYTEAVDAIHDEDCVFVMLEL